MWAGRGQPKCSENKIKRNSVARVGAGSMRGEEKVLKAENRKLTARTNEKLASKRFPNAGNSR